MKSMTVLVGAATLALGIAAGALLAQPPQQGPQPFSVGNRLGLPITPAADGAFDAMSSNVKVYRRDLLGRELLLRSRTRRDRRAEPRRAAERADQQRLDLVHQPRRLGAHRALDRRPEPGASAPA